MMCLAVADTHSTVYNINHHQGPAGQHRELCSILCNNFMVPRGKDGERISGSLGWTWTHCCV